MTVYLTSVQDKFRAVIGQSDTSSAAVENSDADLLFKLPDCGSKGGLGDIKCLGSLVERACFRYSDSVFKLL